MKTQTFSMHLYWDTLNNEYEMYAGRNLNSRYTLYVQPVEVTVEVPESFDVRAAKLASIRAEEAELRAKFQARITELQREANELLAIEMETA